MFKIYGKIKSTMFIKHKKDPENRVFEYFQILKCSLIENFFAREFVITKRIIERKREREREGGKLKERPSSRARREGQDLHHLTVVSRCSECRWSPRGRSSNIAFSSWWHAGCNGRRAPRRRNCAPSRLASAASRTAWRTAIPRPSRRTGTAFPFDVFFFCFRYGRRRMDRGRQRTGTTIPTNDTERRSYHELDTMQSLSRARPLSLAWSFSRQSLFPVTDFFTYSLIE